MKTRAKCINCKYFRNDPAWLEDSIPGLKVMSSGMASVKADDGICLRRNVYLAAYYRCQHFSAAAEHQA